MTIANREELIIMMVLYKNKTPMTAEEIEREVDLLLSMTDEELEKYRQELVIAKTRNN